MKPISLARKAIKTAVLPYGLVARRRAGDLTILLYHRVGDRPDEIELSGAVFERHLAALSERERVLTLDDALAGREGGVVVSIDDGYRDFHERVVPLLVRFRIPAVLYLATGLVADGGPAGPDALTWEHLREAVGTGLVTVGAHTHGHVDLSDATEGVADGEMRRSQELIEDHLGVPCRHFAYPWAVGSPAADRVARRLFDSAALDAWKTNRRGRTDPHRLGRTPVLRSDGTLFFSARARGLLLGEALAYR
ncbi:MAG: polysaccharide deacetylase family protein, partial [Actinomycetota bacterium]